MRYQITDNALILTVSPAEQAELQLLRDADPDKFDTDSMMADLFEPLTSNDSFMWVTADITGDLTDAPILAILGDEEQSERSPEEVRGEGLWNCAFDSRQDKPYYYQPVLYRWAFMGYQVESPQLALLERGKAVFTGGEHVVREGQMGLCIMEREHSFLAGPWT